VSAAELLGAAIGWTLVALGAASIVAWGIRRRQSDRLLLFFGIWCCLYGVRLVAQQAFVRATIGGSPLLWQYLIAFATYSVNVPAALFVEALIGSGWKNSIRRIWQVQAAYAIAAIGIDLVLRRPAAAMLPNNGLVLAGLIVWVGNLWLYRHRLSPLFKTPATLIGGGVLVLFVINENLRRPVGPATNIEPLGILAFVVCLGYGVIGTAFRNEAELLAVSRELETARGIQTALLPRGLPRVHGVDLAACYLPMTAVAGDLYDFAVLGPGRIGILVADVSGHGIPAALVASMVKLAFSAQSARADDPAAVLTRMNRILCTHMEGSFVTAIYAVVDAGRRTILYANAGHPPFLIGRGKASVDTAGAHGGVLGLFPDWDYTNATLDLRTGDRILLFTDGVLEAQNARGEFLDEAPVKAWLTSDLDQDAASLADSVLRRLRAWRGTDTFDDDVTFVVARILDDRMEAATP